MTHLGFDGGPGYIADDSTPVTAASHKAHDGVLVYSAGVDSNIESRIHDLHRRYRIPQEYHEELGRMIHDYLKAKASLDKAINRWRSQRGTSGWDLVWLLRDEELEVDNLESFLDEYGVALLNLRGFVARFETNGNERKPHWA